MNSWPYEDPHAAVSLLIIDNDGFDKMLDTVLLHFCHF